MCYNHDDADDNDDNEDDDDDDDDNDIDQSQVALHDSSSSPNFAATAFF